MAKRSTKKKAIQGNVSPVVSDSAESLSKSTFWMVVSAGWVPLLLAVVTFLVYWPSLQSDFIYDARLEILDEGFITSLTNLTAVLSMKVLGMNIILQDRPGQLLYMMLIAAVSGREPFGYHLGSNLLHAANVALLFVLMRRLIATERAGWTGNGARKAQLAAGAVALIFAMHPLAVEAVSEISYCGDLLVTFFTLLALLTAMAFRADHFRTAVLAGSAGIFCAFAAVISKESGLATPLLLIVYWFLFRRKEAKGPWLLFLGAVTAVTVLFLVALGAATKLSATSLVSRIHFAPTSHDYLGGSFSQVFLVQPRLWVFMMGKLLWPADLSADYTLENIDGISTSVALVILAVAVSLQVWLAARSRIGAMGVAFYWLGLVTVSNFIPLYRIVADRFYYLSLAGVAMQLLALLLLALSIRWEFWLALAACFSALLPLTVLNINRQGVFAHDFSLWTDTLRVSPRSASAHIGLGWVFFQRQQVDEAIREFEKALEIEPNFAEVHYNLGTVLVQKGAMDEAIVQFQKALEINPDYAAVRYNLGNALLQKGQVDKAIVQYQKTLEINPRHALACNNLGNARLQKGQVDEAIIEFQKALEIDPDSADAHYNLGLAFVQKGQMNEAVLQFQEAVRLNPSDGSAQNNLARAQALARPPSAGK